MDNQRDLILKSFLIESEEGLAQMEESILELESRPDDTELIQSIFRVAHTMKGNAGILDLRNLLTFAHKLEDLLDAIRKGKLSVTSDITTVLLASRDVFREMADAAGKGKDEMSRRAKDVLGKISRHLTQNSNADKPKTIQEKVAAINSAGEGLQRVDGGLPSVDAPQLAQMVVSREAAHTLRVEIDRLDHMLSLTGEIVIAQGRIRNRLVKLQHPQAREIEDLHRDLEGIYKELQREMMRVRMVPIGPTFRQLKRSVRDISASHGKLAQLEVIGDDVEVDTTVLEHLKDPLLHMIRNAIDHGIEAPDVREGLGKERCGTLKLSAVHANGNIVVKLEDDGAGFNRQQIQDKARRMGLISDNSQVSDQDLLRFVFQAGFSTAKTITDLSGRGVGLDVVKRNIESLRGRIDLLSEEGKGTIITLRLPLTLAIIDGFSVSVGAENFIIPSDYVMECVELATEVRGPAGSGVLNLRGNPLPYVRLREAFCVSGQVPDRENVVVVKIGDFDAGIAVDRLLGTMEAVIKPLGKAFRAVPGIAGSTILENGRVGLIVDVPGLLRDVTPAAFRSNVG